MSFIFHPGLFRRLTSNDLIGGLRNPFRFQNSDLINPLWSQSGEILKCFYWFHVEYIT